MSLTTQPAPVAPAANLEEVDLLLRDAHALAVALSDLSEPARRTDGAALLRLIQPKLAAAVAPLLAGERSIEGRRRTEELRLRRMYSETAAIVRAENESEDETPPIELEPIPEEMQPGHSLRRWWPFGKGEDVAVPGMQSDKVGLDFTSALGVGVVGTMVYLVWRGRR